MATNYQHPHALPFLFLTELWERFGFYVVQGLLVLYMSHFFGYSDSESYTILAVFTALAYISPLAGGLLASKVIGFKTSIFWGGAFLILGYSLLALPYATILFYPALSIIIVGNGLFKPNISSLLGAQYADNDPRRESGFTIFYIGINIGAFLAGLISGYVKDSFGWHVSFSLAAIGLVIGLITFCYGIKYLNNNLKSKLKRKLTYQLLFCCLLSVIALNFLLKLYFLSTVLLPAVGIILFVTLIFIILQQNKDYQKKMFILSILMLSSVVFWMLFFQLFYSANLFVDRLVIKQFFGIPLSTTVFYGSESIFIILLGPLFAWTWQALHAKDQNPSPIIKFILALIFAGLGFVVLAISTSFPNSDGMVHPAWVFFAYLLITIGELLLSPIGLSAVTQLAPVNLVGLMMGVWFVAQGFGGMFAGMLAQLSNVPDSATTAVQKLAVYQNAFFDYAWLAFIVAIFLFLAQFALRKLLRN